MPASTSQTFSSPGTTLGAGSPAEIAGMVVRLAKDRSLNGRVVVWWSEDRPRLIQWGDRGYHDFADFPHAGED